MPTKPTVGVRDAIASNLKEFREAHSPPWTHGDLAREMEKLGFGWTRVTVAEIEGARRRQVSLEEWLALGRVFGRSPLELLCRGKSSVRLDGGLNGGKLALTEADLVTLLLTPMMLKRHTASFEKEIVQEILDRVNQAVADGARYVESKSSELLAWSMDLKKLDIGRKP